MSEQDDALREMARHRGYRLVKSRRRKPGGDFGRFGLKDEDGNAAFGFGDKGLVASAEEVEAFLRDATRATWTRSAGSAKRRPKPKPKPAPPPKPQPLPTLAIANLLAPLPAARDAEAFDTLEERPGFRLERIVSRGQVTPAGEPMIQQRDEWVVLLHGSARLRIEGFQEVTLKPGDYLLIKSGQPHWVTWTSRDEPAVWLALHFD